MLFQLRFLRRHALADSLARVVSLPVANVGVCFISSGLCFVNFGILCRLSLRIGFGSHEPRHIRNFALVSLVCQSSSVCVNFGILRGLSCRVGRGIDFVGCDIPHLFHVCRDGVTAAVQSSITVSASRLLFLHLLRNGRVRKSVIPVTGIAFKSGKAGSMLCDFCRIVRNVFRVGSDVGVLNNLFGLDGVDIGLVGSNAIAKRGIGFRACLCFGGICCLIGRVKVRNSLFAVGGLLRNSSGVCLLCGLCAGDFSVQTGCQVSNVGFNGIQTLAPCRHILYPLEDLFVPVVDKIGKALIVFLELLNQSGQVGDGFLEVGELIVIIGRLDPVFCLSFRVRGQLCALRHIALRGVAVAVMNNNSQRLILPLVVPLHGVGKNRDIPRTDVHRRSAFERGRGARMRGASVRMAAVAARGMRCARNGEIIAITVCHNECSFLSSKQQDDRTPVYQGQAVCQSAGTPSLQGYRRQSARHRQGQRTQTAPSDK